MLGGPATDRTRAATRVLYGDTDSLFVQVSEELAVEAAYGEAERLRARVQDELSAQIRAEWGARAEARLELEHVYERFFQPSVRGTQGSRSATRARQGPAPRGRPRGRAPRLAELARAAAARMLERVFRDEPVAPFVREVVADSPRRPLDPRARDPQGAAQGRGRALHRRHAAARPGRAQGGPRRGPGRARRAERAVARARRARRQLPAEPDRAHDVEKVVRRSRRRSSAARQSFDEVIGAPRQLSLL